MKTITETALAKRIRRALAPSGETLRKGNLGSKLYPIVGELFVVDGGNMIAARTAASERRDTNWACCARTSRSRSL